MDPYIENKENFSNVYNLRPNRTLEKLVTDRKKSYSTNKNFLLKSPKSHTTLLSVRSLNFLWGADSILVNYMFNNSLINIIFLYFR